MRMAFGLVSLLVVMAIILMLFKSVQAPMLKEGKKAQDQARAMSGRDEDGVRVTDAVMLEGQDKAGKMESVVVSDVTANSAIQQRYGLQKGDVILQIGPLSVRDNMSSADEAKDFLLDAYQKNQDLVVIRGWDKLTLPMAEGSAPAVAAAPAPAPADSASPAAATPADPTSPAAPGAQADASQTPSKAKAPKPAAPRKEPPKSAMERQLDLIRNIPGQ
jgi:hypothetical protein